MSYTRPYACWLVVSLLTLSLASCTGARPEGEWEPDVPANAREVDVNRKLEGGSVTTVEELLIGEPGIVYEGGTVRIRGRSGAPLWIIDGARVTSSIGISPYDVARMWVVDDAINPRYGRQAVNGIIIVQTRTQ